MHHRMTSANSAQPGTRAGRRWGSGSGRAAFLRISIINRHDDTMSATTRASYFEVPRILAVAVGWAVASYYGAAAARTLAPMLGSSLLIWTHLGGQGVIALACLLNAQSGLGWNRVQHRWLMALMCLVALLPLLLALGMSPGVTPYHVRIAISWPSVILVIAVVPFIEEWFWRGWLWSRLQQVWPLWSVALVTGMGFILVHLFVRPGALSAHGLTDYIISTMMLTGARWSGNSTKASILVHIAINFTAVLLGFSGLMGPP